jgi:hypothetical protein
MMWATKCTKDGRKLDDDQRMPGAGLSWATYRKAPSDKPAFQPYWGKPAVRNDREDRGNVGIIRSPIRVSILPDQSPRAESAQEVCDQLVAAAKYIDKQRLGSTDDCGFSPFSIDTKPNHGSPDYARDIAFQKIANRVAGTKMAAEKLGVH